MRKSIAEAVAVIAQICLPTNEWPELMPGLIELGGRAEVVHRQTSMKLLDSLVNCLGGAFAMNFDSLQPVLARGLADSDIEVQLSALNAVGDIVSYLEPTQMVRDLEF